jgi:glycosyltransferase involved in cell wall biosynthesis
VLHLAASARGRRIVPFFMGDWAGGLTNRSGAGTAALKIANLPWQLYHRSLLTYRNVLSTGPHMGHPTVRLVAFFPQLAGSNRPAPLRSRQKPPGEIRLLSIGRLTLAKGVDLLIRSLSALPDRFVLTVAGDGPERMALQELARHANVASRVTFAGHLGRSALRDLYDTNDVLVIPSRTEGIPKVLLEGIAAGIRVVAPAVGGIPHVPAISDFAQLFAPGNIQSLTAAIRLAADAASGPQRREALQAWPACLTSLDATAVIQALL